MPYHIAIGRNAMRSNYQLDLTKQQVYDFYVNPLKNGESVFIGGVKLSAEEVSYFQIRQTTKNSQAVMKLLWQRYNEYEEKARLRHDTFNFPIPGPKEVFLEGRDLTLNFIDKPFIQAHQGQSPTLTTHQETHSEFRFNSVSNRSRKGKNAEDQARGYKRDTVGRTLAGTGNHKEKSGDLRMNSNIEQSSRATSLFDRVVSILEQARTNSVYAVNSQMVIAYWLIGREIVEELQNGDERAGYGKRLIKDLANKLINSYGSGYSVPNLKNFRLFYLTYQGRITRISYPPGSQSPGESIPKPTIVPICHHKKSYPVGSQSDKGFHPNLSWSHYRALMRVENENARDFYEMEAARCGWSKRDLERQIATLYYERILASHDKPAMFQDTPIATDSPKPVDMLKDPYILEFLNLPDSPKLHESELEQALINNLQKFLLELGSGFSYVARQKHIRIGEKSFYVDLVFYNYMLKCFVLIDLKVGELTHQDIGQMDGYLRFYEDQFKVKGDNPSIGLILCSKKDDAVAHYSILKDNKKLFASRYKLILPNEEVLRKELERERRLLEERIAMDGDRTLE